MNKYTFILGSFRCVFKFQSSKNSTLDWSNRAVIDSSRWVLFSSINFDANDFSASDNRFVESIEVTIWLWIAVFWCGSTIMYQSATYSRDCCIFKILTRKYRLREYFMRSTSIWYINSVKTSESSARSVWLSSRAWRAQYIS